MQPPLTFATRRRYDTKFLMDGVVRVEGFEIDYLSYRGPGGMTEFFRRMVTDLPYDIGEQALAHYLIARDQGKPLTAIPVFPSRFFPHLGVSVRSGSSIRLPGDLVGKTVGVPDWGFNPGVWMRGVLQHQYQVPLEQVRWLENAHEPLFRGLSYPRDPRFEIRGVPLDDDDPSHGFGALMDAGEVDAVFLAAGGIDTENTRKLFPDPYPEIRAYMHQTGIFPINTVITLRQDVVNDNPDLPARLMQGWNDAQALYRQEMREGREQDHMGLDVKTLQTLGVFPAEYGLEPNRAALQTMIDYCVEQGLIRTHYRPEDLFVESVG